MKIIVFGWFGHKNIGDEAFIESFKKIYKEHELTFVNSIKKEHLNSFDFCIFGGGDIVNKKMLNEIGKLSCPKIALSVSVTKNSICDELKYLEHIYVRDLMSLQILKENNYENCTYLPDVVLTMVPNKENGKRLITKYFADNKRDCYENVYGIVTNAHIIGNRTSDFKSRTKFLQFVNDLSEMIDDTNASFIFLPFSTGDPWDDRVVNGLVQSQTVWWKKNVVVRDELSIQDTLDIISACDNFVSMRYHATIMCLLSHVQVTTIGIHDKFVSICNEFDLNYIDYWQTNSSNIKTTIQKMNDFNDFKIKNLKKQYNEILLSR